MAIFNTVPPLKAGSGIQFDGEAISTRAAPRNLLDNSDFRKPVNQRGQSSYTKGSWGGYTIDRWAVGSGTKNTVNIVTDGVSVKGAIIQWLEDVVTKAFLGKKVTCAAKVNSVVYVLSGVVPDNTGWTKISTVEFDGGDVTLAVNADKRFEIAIACATQKTIEWAALYEGEYTAETLPEYQPKGYAEERLACTRYFMVANAWRPIYGNVSWNGQISLTVPTPVEMRINPTGTVIKGTLYVNGVNIDINENPANVIKTSNGLQVILSTKAEANAKHNCAIEINDTAIYFSADL